MSTKKYFWLRQPSTFFQDPKIKKLRKIAGGDTYTIIYQKIMLLSIVNGGVIQYEHIEDSLAKELALILDEEEDNVRVTLSFMQSQGLLEELNNEEFLLPSVPALIGTETDSAERVRRFREKHNNEKALHCNGAVTTCNTELEINIELEKEIYTKKEKKKESVALTVCDDPHDVANYLLQKILNHQPTFKKPNINEWAKEIDRAIRIDGRSKEELMRCIDWIYSTPKGSFWISNILSGRKLREKFDTMKMQASQQQPTQQKNTMVDAIYGQGISAKDLIERMEQVS